MTLGYTQEFIRRNMENTNDPIKADKKLKIHQKMYKQPLKMPECMHTHPHPHTVGAEFHPSLKKQKYNSQYDNTTHPLVYIK